MCPCLFHFADHTALLWSIETGRCLVKYTGHVGSGEHPDVTGSPVGRCAEPFQDSGALSRMGGWMDRQPPCCQVWAPGGTAQHPERRRAKAVCVLCCVAQEACGASWELKCVRYPSTATHVFWAAPSRTPCVLVLWPGFGHSSPVPLRPLPLEGSTSSRPVRQPPAPPFAVPPAPNSCGQTWRWCLPSASGASSAHLPTCQGSEPVFCQGQGDDVP